MTVVTEIARAKVNLFLRVLGRRPDGYHELVSLVAFAAARDTISLDGEAPRGVVVFGPFGDEITGANIADAALAALAKTEPRLRLGRVTISKALPVAAGIGGGSADAAAVLRAVRALNPDTAVGVDWDGIALALGADVPVCLASSACVMRGVGEQIEPRELPALPAVLVNPRAAVPADKTRRVFQALHAGPVRGDAGIEVPGRIEAGPLLALMRDVGNDLRLPAATVVPAIDVVMSALAASPRCRLAQLSGGGPTCFGIFDTDEDASVAARAISAAHPGWWVQPTTLA